MCVIFRYYKLKMVRLGTGLSNKACVMVSLSLIAAFLAVFVAYYAYLISEGRPFAVAAELCLRGPSEARDVGPVPKISSVLSTMVPPAVSLVSDVLILKNLGHVGIEDALAKDIISNKRNNYTVPVQATVLSALSFVPYIAIVLLLALLRSSKQIRTLDMMHVGAAVNAARFPLTARLTFVAKDMVDTTSRERRQEREREFARKAKREREEARRMALNQLAVADQWI